MGELIAPDVPPVGADVGPILPEIVTVLSEVGAIVPPIRTIFSQALVVPVDFGAILFRRRPVAVRAVLMELRAVLSEVRAIRASARAVLGQVGSILADIAPVGADIMSLGPQIDPIPLDAARGLLCPGHTGAEREKTETEADDEHTTHGFPPSCEPGCAAFYRMTRELARLFYTLPLLRELPVDRHVRQ